MGTRTVSRTSRPHGIASKLAQYVMLGSEEATVRQRRAEVKRDLLTFVEANHEVDEDKGHLLHTLPEPVTIGGVAYSGFMKQRRTGATVFLEDKAEELCAAKGFDLDDYTTRYVDQDKVARLYAEDRLTDEEFNSLSEKQPDTWAFLAVKE